MQNPIIVGITGGSGSGKSTLAREIRTELGADQVSIVEQDWFYRDLGKLPWEVAAKSNFDHPDAIEVDLLARALSQLAAGKDIQAPQYDFYSFTRKTDPIEVKSARLIILEGLFTLHFPELRELLDTSIFVDVPSEIRLERRILRDIADRGYKRDQILDFWRTRAEPMFETFVLPQQNHATLVWKSLEDRALVTEFLADLQNRLARNANKPTTR